MMSFAHPWLLAVAPLPLLIYWLMPAAKPPRGGALRVPFFESASTWGGGPQVRGRKWMRTLLQALAWVALVVAAAAPLRTGQPVAIPTEGRDLMLAIDLSGSMSREDFSTRRTLVDRLTVVKAVANDFIKDRHGDRVGLILFGSRAYLQTPLTSDLESVGAMLKEAEIGLAGDKTAIGDAIGVAVKTLREREADEKVLVLLSDGASNSGVLEPVQAAEMAKESGIRIHTIGVGADTMEVQTFFGTRRVNPAEDLDEQALSDIAEKTGGVFFRAKSPEALKDIYQQIDKLEPTAGEDSFLLPTQSLFHWPLALSLLLSTLIALMHLSPFRSRTTLEAS